MIHLSLLQSVFLGFVQGLTEFLPVSSSAHLVLIQHVMGLNDPNVMLALDVTLHFGTLIAVVAYFRKDLLEMLSESVRWARGGNAAPFRELKRYPHVKLLLSVGFATLPAVVVGLGFKGMIERLFVSPKVAGFGLMVTGVILWLTRRKERGSSAEQTDLTAPVSAVKAGLIGCAQAVAITPGISRSGSTIAAGLFCGLDRAQAARFSFLMSIPAILGSVVLESENLRYLQQGWFLPVAAGTLVSCIAGVLSIRWLLRVIIHGRLHWFAYYCWIIGAWTLWLLKGA